MKHLRWAALPLLVGLGACSSSSDTTSDGATGGDGSGDGGTTPSACSETLATNIVSFADVTNQGPARPLYPATAMTPDGTQVAATWISFTSGTAGKVNFAIYGLDGSVVFGPTTLANLSDARDFIGTSIAASSNGFGVAWTDQATPPGASSAYPIVMFEILGSDGKVKVPATSANDQLGRNGAEDFVAANGGDVTATADGFFVAWQDTRDLEPVVLDVNIADASGVYARTFKADGTTTTQDSQVMQTGAIRFDVNDSGIAWIDSASQNVYFLPAAAEQLNTTGGVQDLPPGAMLLGPGSNFPGYLNLATTSSGTAVTLTTTAMPSELSLSWIDSSSKVAALGSVDTSSGVIPGTSVVDYGAALGMLWIEQAPNAVGVTDPTLTIRAADLNGNTTQNVRSLGTTTGTGVTSGRAATVAGTVTVPVLTHSTTDLATYLSVATICGAASQ